MGYFSNLAIEYEQYKNTQCHYDVSLTTHEQQLLWRWEDLQELHAELCVLGCSYSSSVTYTDDELFTAANALSAKRFELSTKVLGKNQKIEIAKELHYGYNASNKQIKRVLRIDEAVVNELFPPKVSSR